VTSAKPDLLIDVDPFFITTRNGGLFASRFFTHGTNPDEYLLIVPPFAEEMNKCRRMTTLLAHRLAALGMGVILIDLSGTGESWGDFHDASYELWLDDLATVQDWIVAKDARLTCVLGIRFGALPALQFARDCQTCKQILLWQPAVSGKVVLSQFLRLRVAANMMAQDGSGDSVASLTAAFSAGESVEVAGYNISPELFRSINELQLTELPPRTGQRIAWFQITPMKDSPIPPAGQRVIDTLTDQGANIDSRCIQGDAFWNATEITTCDALIDATVAMVLP